jgi:hypothetical protein
LVLKLGPTSDALVRGCSKELTGGAYNQEGLTVYMGKVSKSIGRYVAESEVAVGVHDAESTSGRGCTVRPQPLRMPEHGVGSGSVARTTRPLGSFAQ